MANRFALPKQLIAPVVQPDDPLGICDHLSVLGVLDNLVRSNMVEILNRTREVDNGVDWICSLEAARAALISACFRGVPGSVYPGSRGPSYPPV
jgi:hypothetical protein